MTQSNLTELSAVYTGMLQRRRDPSAVIESIDNEKSTQQLLISLGLRAKAAGLRIATAESCTGGLIAALCTSSGGSSDWFDCGLVVYSSSAKQRLLNVSHTVIVHYGLVSEPVARDMALGALLQSTANVSVAVTGVAGPSGGDIGTPVGTVWFAWARRSSSTEAPEIQQTSEYLFTGDRSSIRRQAALTAIRGLINIIG